MIFSIRIYAYRYIHVSRVRLSQSAHSTPPVYIRCAKTLLYARPNAWLAEDHLLDCWRSLIFYCSTTHTHADGRLVGRSMSLRERERPNSICVYLELADACGEPKQFADFMLDHTNIVHLAIRCSNIFSQHNVLTIRYHHSRRTSYQSPHIISVTNATKKKKKQRNRKSKWVRRNANHTDPVRLSEYMCMTFPRSWQT